MRVTRRMSLQLKVIGMIVALMALVMATIIPITIQRQKNDLLEAARSTLAVVTDMLNLQIKSIMLAGEAPIAVRTIENLQSISEFKAINLYRTTGERAFQDFATLDFVNGYQNFVAFERTDRVAQAMADYPLFKEVVANGRAITHELVDTREMEYFFPLRNERDCMGCHGDVATSGPLRGIAHFKISIAGIYRQINQASFLLTGFLSGAVILFALLLIAAIRMLVLRPLLHIGTTVMDFGSGRMDSKVDIKSQDELGELAERINQMFASVEERLKLSKYVSRSTDAMIRQRDTGQDGLKKPLVVLFTDVRGFTRFSDQADPQLVIERLNSLLDIQASVVERLGGDIDKFIGDSVMALFTEPLKAVEAALEMVLAVHRLTREWDYPLHIGAGLNYGEVVSGNIGSHSRLEYAVIGDTVNLASRLCGVAPPNTVLISATLHRALAGKLEVKAVENRIIKGKAEPVTYYAVRRILQS